MRSSIYDEKRIPGHAGCHEVQLVGRYLRARPWLALDLAKRPPDPHGWWDLLNRARWAYGEHTPPAARAVIH